MGVQTSPVYWTLFSILIGVLIFIGKLLYVEVKHACQTRYVHRVCEGSYFRLCLSRDFRNNYGDIYFSQSERTLLREHINIR